MRIGVLGTGDVGRTLGSAFVDLGHDVKMGSRSAAGKAVLDWVRKTGPKASAGSFGEAASFGEIVVLATLGVAVPDAIASAGADSFRGKTVIDATNPLDFGAGMPPTLAISGKDSGGEQTQRLLPEAFVVKAFNTVGHAHMYRPGFRGGPPDMFICGDNEDAKQMVATILREFGWGIADVGGITASRYLEAMCLLWVLYGIKANSWDHAFKLLRK
jgi:predicted dinucleotide-binding enzyme